MNRCLTPRLDRRTLLPKGNSLETTMSGAGEGRPPDVAEQLKRAIVASGRSLNRLAKESGLHAAQLSRFVRGERTLTLSAAARVCVCLGLGLVKTEGGGDVE